jgi:hypothetical protein
MDINLTLITLPDMDHNSQNSGDFPFVTNILKQTGECTPSSPTTRLGSKATG